VIALALGAAGGLAAQQPGRPGMADQMQMMDSLNTRLDSLVARMNNATGNRKVTAMAEVIHEMVVQRKAMQERMHKMMGGRDGMMKMMADSAPVPPNAGARPDSAAADTAGHAGHHPPK
jgi:hypothetical protein